MLISYNKNHFSKRVHLHVSEFIYLYCSEWKYCIFTITKTDYGDLIVMKFNTKYLQSAFILLRHSILQRDSEQNIQENYPKGFKEDFILQLIRFSI